MSMVSWITKRTAVPDRIGKRHVGKGRELIELAAATSRRDVGNLVRMERVAGRRRGGRNSECVIKIQDLTSTGSRWLDKSETGANT
ncbi:hypothetical protein E4U32_002940 [Claviceps aff. humidiphila group G2b]|nr:hypothetical protein E4U32_002940 [Claviceps aff. humidiphila group G2b]